jgi:O-antigen/teichoic acid export membrane protein
MSNTPPQLQSPGSVQSVRPNQSTLVAAKGGAILFAGRLFVYASRFLIAVFVARILGAGQYGLYNLGLVAVELTTFLASLGMATTLVRYIPIFNSRKDEAGIWGALQIGLGLTTLLSLLAGAGLYILAEPMANQLFNEPRLVPLLRLVSIAVPIFNLGDMAAAATRGFKNMKYTVIAQNFAHPIARAIILIILFLSIGLNAKRALLTSLLAEVVVVVLLLYFLNKQFLLFRPLNTGRRDLKEFLQFSWPVYLSNFVWKFGGNIKTVLLGAFGAVTNVGIFALANQITLLGDMFHDSLGSVAQPIIAELHSQGKQAELKHFYQLMTKWTVTINMPLFLVLVLFPDEIMELFGQSFAAGALILRILAWTGLVDIATGICGVMLDMTGFTRLKLANTTFTLAVSIGLSIWLIPIWGLIGAAVASLAASIIVNVLRVVEIFFLLRILPYNLAFLKPITAGLVTAGVILIGQIFLLPQANLLYLFANILVLFTIYVGMTLLLGISAEDKATLAHLRTRLGAKFLRG